MIKSSSFIPISVMFLEMIKKQPTCHNKCVWIQCQQIDFRIFFLYRLANKIEISRRNKRKREQERVACVYELLKTNT